MIGFVIRALISALGLWLAARFVRGISYDALSSLLWAALALGIANAIVRPILILLTLPFTILTLGLFLFVVNGVVLWLVGHLVPGFHVHGLWDAILGSIIVGLTGWVGSWFVGSRGFETRERR